MTAKTFFKKNKIAVVRNRDGVYGIRPATNNPIGNP